jgi:mannosyltransferase OCH1-like enzyme
MRIPKIIHIVWIGDEQKTPREMIHTWRKFNPEWIVKIWGNHELKTVKWINQKHINAMVAANRMCGAADIMRYEILFHHGGFTVDADSVCLRPLEDWLFDSQVCASMENEMVRPGLVANGYLAAESRAALIAELIMELGRRKTVLDDLPWRVTGPLLLSETINRLKYSNITLWPSHYFIPEHFTGQRYLGKGHVFARQIWGSTKGLNDQLVNINVS